MAPKRSLDLPVAQNESITVDLDPLPPPDDLQVFIEALIDESAPSNYWTRLATQCWIHDRKQEAIQISTKGVQLLSSSHRPAHAIPLLNLLSAFSFTRANASPKQILHDAKYQNLSSSSDGSPNQPKQFHHLEAISHINRAQPLDPNHPLNLLTKAIYATSTGDNDAAFKLFESLLSIQPSNSLAMLGKACILLRRRQYAPALRLYQDVLRISVAIQARADAGEPCYGWKGPDPRVGIGLCLWGLGHHQPARKAWQRAVALNPNNAAPHLLLGLSAINASKQTSTLPPGSFGAQVERSEDEARALAYSEGLASLQSAWNLDKRNAMTAVALCEHFVAKAGRPEYTGSKEAEAAAMAVYANALKLGEHAIQYADSRAAVVHAWLCYARAAHLASLLPSNPSAPELRLQAQRYYTRAIEDLSRSNSAAAGAGAGGSAAGQQLAPGLALAVLGLAQCQVANRDPLAAMNTLDSITSKPASASSTLELCLLAASLRAKSHPGATAAEKLADAEKARIMLDRALRLVEAASIEAYGVSESESEEMPPNSADNGAVALNGKSRKDPFEAVSGPVAKAQEALRREELSLSSLEAIASLAQDPQTHVEFAALLQTHDLTRATAAYAEALRLAIKGGDGGGGGGEDLLIANIQNNLGAILTLRAIEYPEKAFTTELQKEERAWLHHRGISRLESALVTASSGGKSNAHANGNGNGVASGSVVLPLEVQRSLDAVKLIASYNLGRANEAIGNHDRAKEAYESLLKGHPEYVDAKVRLAILAASDVGGGSSWKGATELKRQRELANSYFKEALASDAANLDTRAAYTCFLAGEMAGNPTASWGAIKEMAAQLFAGGGADKGKSAAFGSVQAAKAAADEGRKDPHTLASLGWAYYQLAIHTRAGPNARAERSKGMMRAADLMDKALIADPRCAFAAQGLAILCAEDALGEISGGGGQGGVASAEERRKRGADQAIALLSKIREVREDASVHVCMGHALMIKEEFERALKAYELGLSLSSSKRSSSDSNNNKSSSSIRQYLARAEYAIGMKKKSHSNLESSIEHLKGAIETIRGERVKVDGGGGGVEVEPIEVKQILYNLAVTCQKALQMLLETDKGRRTSSELERATERVQEMQPMLKGALLEEARKGGLSYITSEVVEQRWLYAESSLLRQAPRQVEEQKRFEEEEERRKEALARSLEEKEERLREERRRKEEENLAAVKALEEKRRLAAIEARGVDYGRDATPEREGGGGGKRASRKEGGGGRKKKSSSRDDGIIESDEEDDLFGGGGGGEEYGGSDIVDDESDGGGEESGEGEERRKRRKKERLERRERKLKAKEEKKKKKSRGDGEAATKSQRKIKRRRIRASEEEEEEEEEEGGGGGEEEGKRRKKQRITNDIIDSDEEALLLEED
ncbi:TPR-like protein [Violaceomyces palustris]|uniref:TPR-like protein n=1 Tax=Violaceomyces palustris TaxID=1673888 RepID=A0ACD0NP14_9BASI|nr:TPR-like protein [Violaceomyces palustris]